MREAGTHMLGVGLIAMVAHCGSGADAAAPALGLDAGDAGSNARDAVAGGDDVTAGREAGMPARMDAGIEAAADAGAGTDASVDAASDANENDLAAGLLQLTAACTKVVSQHRYALDNGQMTDICALEGAIFWTADMDIDCDGKTTAQCNAMTDCCYQNDTAFHNLADEPLTASITPYVVIPSDFTYPGLDRQNGGNVTAVIYRGKLAWAVFGDTGPTDIIGEASYACAEKLGIDPDPKNGGTGSGVTYVTFVGAGTSPHDIEDQAETASLGEALARALLP